MACLRYQTPEGDHEFQLGDECTIGRLPACDVKLSHDQKVGRSHARIRRMENDYLIEDLGSRNGTFLERGYSVMQIMAATPLQSDDVIRISSVRLRFTQSAELPTSPRFPHPPAGAAADEVRISVEPVGSLLEPTVIRQDETVVRAGLPPPPPPPAVNHGGESEELRQAREEIAKLRREVADLSRELGELQTRLGQR